MLQPSYESNQPGAVFDRHSPRISAAGYFPASLEGQSPGQNLLADPEFRVQQGVCVSAVPAAAIEHRVNAIDVMLLADAGIKS
jgi:hypothetical protein